MSQVIRKIPVCEPLYLGRENEYVSDAVKSGWVSSAGPYLQRFESEFSAFCGVSHGVATTSGTAALHLALLAAGIKKGDEVVLIGKQKERVVTVSSFSEQSRLLNYELLTRLPYNIPRIVTT